MRILVIFVFALCLSFLACKQKETVNTAVNLPSTNDTASTNNGIAGRIGTSISDFEIIPKVKVGPIKPNFDQDSLVAHFGAENVQLSEQTDPEQSETYMMSVIFPNTKNQLMVRWLKGQDMKKIESIRIESDSSDWHSPEGIKVGMSMADLVKINGKDFKFFGFDWDYAGMTNMWEGGKINKNLTVILEPSNPEAVYEKPTLLGDKQYSSANALAKKAEIKVLSLIVKM